MGGFGIKFTNLCISEAGEFYTKMPSLYDDLLPQRRGSTRTLSIRLPIPITISGLCEARLLNSPMSLRRFTVQTKSVWAPQNVVVANLLGGQPVLYSGR